MATATKRANRKSAKNPAARKPTGKSKRNPVASAPVETMAAKPSKNGAAVKSAGPGKFAPNQPPITRLEDVDERVPALDEACQQVLADKDTYTDIGQKIAEGLEKVGALLKEHNLDCYIINGKKFYEEPGEPHVKITKVKQG